MATKPFTWQDVLATPDDGMRYEAIEGKLYVTPPPTYRHQRISLKLERALMQLLEDAGHGVVAHAPVGVEFPDTKEGVQPDILFVSRGRLEIVSEDWIRGAPDLVIEILSPATAERDRGLKRKLYERHGVGEYWIVDPDAEEVEVWRFAAGARRPERCRERLAVHVAGELVGLVDLSSIFERP
jgi:Uma2 family endonuclease